MKYFILFAAIIIGASLRSSLTAGAVAPDRQLHHHHRAAATVSTAKRSLTVVSDLFDKFIGGGGGGGSGDNIMNIDKIDLEDLLEQIDLEDILDDIDLENFFGNINWDEIDINLDNVNWGMIDWDRDGAWEEWLENWANEVIGVNLDNLSVCSVVETAIGMSSAFGEEAGCKCVGDMESGFQIDCGFKGCAFESTDDETCGIVDLSFTFGSPNGEIDVGACVDMDMDDLEKVCFSYGIDATNGWIDPSSQTCEATYGEQSCDCDIDESFCLYLDCSAVQDGAKMDTCQSLSLHDEELGKNAFVPKFAVFRASNNDNENDNESGGGDNTTFKNKGDKTKTCKSVREKIEKFEGKFNGMKAAKKAEKWCKKKVNDNNDRIGNVCTEACKGYFKQKK